MTLELAAMQLTTGGGSTSQLAVRPSAIYGLGCFARTYFPARKKIALYAGELVRGRRRIEARLSRQDAIKIIRLDSDLAIDGAVGGDATAYINHSCAPNAFMRIVPGHKVAFFALRDIQPGEELTIDYRDAEHPAVCRCGTAQCRSTKPRQ
jgi:SET domain-containing protein